MGAIKKGDSKRLNMAAPTGSTTDKGVGVGLALGILAVIGAIVMAVGAPDLEAAWGFAAAMVFGSLAVVAIHLYFD